MANASTTGFGLRTTILLEILQQLLVNLNYKIKSGLGVGIFKNNPVSLQDAVATKVIYKMQVSQQLMTVDQVEQRSKYWTRSSNWCVQRLFFVNSTTSKPTFANSVAASTTFGTDYNTGSNDGIGFVNDNPHQEYVIKADAAVTQAMIGDAGYNTNSFTAGC